MAFQFVFLWTDILIYILVAAIFFFVVWVCKHQHLREPWRHIAKRPLGMSAAVILLAYSVIGLLDSIHFHPEFAHQPSQKIIYSTHVESLLDVLIQPLGENDEETYSAPFALYAFTKFVVRLPNGREIRAYPRLIYAGQHLRNINQRDMDITLKSLRAIIEGFIVWIIISKICIFIGAKKTQQPFMGYFKKIVYGKTFVAWRSILITVGVIILFAFLAMILSQQYHIFGTNKVGEDIFYEAIKSIRTGLIIGTLTTLVMLPFAIILGTVAGFLGGFFDDVIQYIYTTLSSIPGVLLITAAILSLQIFMANHPHYFSSLASWADVRLLALCVVLGVTSWTNLCRLLRAETLKLREMDFVLAARAMGVKQHTIISRHILPNLMHIILITIVLDFSMLVLAEAVLSYVGVGVDPATISWGNMINGARLELAREPIVWWPLTAAFIFMFILVFSANLFADCVRDAFDPRLRNSN